MNELDFFNIPSPEEDALTKKKHEKDALERKLKQDELVTTPTITGEVLFDLELEKKRIKENLDWLKSMKVEEFTFYKKWEELQDVTIQPFNASVVRAKIWSPTNLQNEDTTIKEILNLKPVVVPVVLDHDTETWMTLRMYCHTAEYNSIPGRSMRFLLVDENSGKILGFAGINSEMPGLGERDKLIGFNRKVWMGKNGDGTQNHSTQCTTIAATQPFGCNFLGGKLMACMLTTEAVREAYFGKYGDVLVGMTTTSLYGPNSMYNGLKWWDGVGISAGTISLQPSPDIYEKWHQWIKKTQKDKYQEKMTQKEGISGPVTSPKLRVLGMIFKEAGIKASNYNHGYHRGCYYSCFYTNGFEFLRGEIDESKLTMKPLFQGGSKTVLDWWRPKAIKRYQKLKAENRLSSEKLFYESMKGMTYEKAKETFFSAVGR